MSLCRYYSFKIAHIFCLSEVGQLSQYVTCQSKCSGNRWLHQCSNVRKFDLFFFLTFQYAHTKDAFNVSGDICTYLHHNTYKSTKLHASEFEKKNKTVQ